MTYQRHWLLSWGGTIGGNKDIWANNVRMMNRETASSDSIDDVNMNRLLDGFLPKIRTFVADPRTKISSQVLLTWVKFNEIGPDGRYVNANTTFARYLAGTTGALATAKGAVTSTAAPPYQSVCVTTLTAKNRGPGSHGRLFLPFCVPTLSFEGYVDAASTTDIANSAASFFTALGNEPGIDVTAIAPYVVSAVGAPGPAHRITSVKVGNVPDIISRRKNAYPETYTAATVSTG